jgi:hypothetical protein
MRKQQHMTPATTAIIAPSGKVPTDDSAPESFAAGGVEVPLPAVVVALVEVETVVKVPPESPVVMETPPAVVEAPPPVEITGDPVVPGTLAVVPVEEPVVAVDKAVVRRMFGSYHRKNFGQRNATHEEAGDVTWRCNCTSC